MFACLFPCFISMLASLDLGFAMLCTLHGFMLVWLLLSLLGLVWMWPFMRYNPSCWCAWYAPFSAPCDVDMLALLALHHLFGFLCFFAHLPTCLCMSLCVIHTSIQWNYEHSIETYICPPKTPPFCLITCLFAPVWHLFLACLLACFPSICFFACLLVCFLLSLHLHAWSEDIWGTGAGVIRGRKCNVYNLQNVFSRYPLSSLLALLSLLG